MSILQLANEVPTNGVKYIINAKSNRYNYNNYYILRENNYTTCISTRSRLIRQAKNEQTSTNKQQLHSGRKTNYTKVRKK
jgi:hypothetical protein